MNSKYKKYYIFLLFFLLSLCYPILNFESFKKNLSKILPQSIKLAIKEQVIGKDRLKIMEDLYNTRKIQNDYNQKKFPQTEFVDINFKKLSLKKFNLKTAPAKNNKMFAKPETTSFYLEYIDNKVLIVSVLGKFIFLDAQALLDQRIEKVINPEINLYEEISKVLDVLIYNQKILISYAKLHKENCYKIGVMMANYNENLLRFEKFFSNDECVESIYAGKIIHYKFQENEGILLSTDALAKKKFAAQDLSSNLGKIIFIDLSTFEPTIFSKGHRNPQGLFNDNGIIISTEHGPRGGDEINIIDKGNNYGWPLSSYGEPYLYEKYETHDYNYLKSHREKNFIEPVYSFVPSIGISQLIKVPKKFNHFWENDFLISSLNGGSIFRTKIDKKNNKILYNEKIFLNERIRDIIYIDELNTVLLALENTGSIGVIKSYKNDLK